MNNFYNRTSKCRYNSTGLVRASFRQLLSGWMLKYVWICRKHRRTVSRIHADIFRSQTSCPHSSSSTTQEVAPDNPYSCSGFPQPQTQPASTPLVEDFYSPGGVSRWRDTYVAVNPDIPGINDFQSQDDLWGESSQAYSSSNSNTRNTSSISNREYLYPSSPTQAFQFHSDVSLPPNVDAEVPSTRQHQPSRSVPHGAGKKRSRSRIPEEDKQLLRKLREEDWTWEQVFKRFNECASKPCNNNIALQMREQRDKAEGVSKWTQEDSEAVTAMTKVLPKIFSDQVCLSVLIIGAEMNCPADASIWRHQKKISKGLSGKDVASKSYMAQYHSMSEQEFCCPFGRKDLGL
jgi:hypothetical protein